MATAKATLSNFRQAPRKMRMVVNAIRGKKVSDALVNLDFIAKKSSAPLKNLILSAVANAKNLDIPVDNLVVKTIKVDSGPILYRRRPAARGSAHPIRKRTASVFIELGEKVVESKKSKVKKEVKLEVEKPKTTKGKTKVAKENK